jgi:hypothetical protein
MCLKSHKFSALEFAQSFPKHYFLPLEACETSHLCKGIFLTSNLENYGNKILLLLQIVKRDQIRKKGQYNSTWQKVNIEGGLIVLLHKKLCTKEKLKNEEKVITKSFITVEKP